MKHLYAFFCLFLLSNVVTADNHILTLEQLRQANIVGAFGQKLGAVVDEKLEFVGETDTGALEYEFKPEKPYPTFEKYSVFATPRTKRIFGVLMSSGSLFNCDQQRRVLNEVLSQKYGNLVESDEGPYKDGQRTISLWCNRGSNLNLWYQDLLIQHSVLEEKASLIDKSNF